MNTKKPNTLLQFFIIGLIYCFILKNFISIVNGSYGGDPTYIISNPSIDGELWYIIGITYLLTVKVFFEDFFRNVISQIKTYKMPNKIIEKYYHYSKSRFFKALIVVVFSAVLLRINVPWLPIRMSLSVAILYIYYVDV